MVDAQIALEKRESANHSCHRYSCLRLDGSTAATAAAAARALLAAAIVHHFFEHVLVVTYAHVFE